jgi:2-hydroxy-3-keto-5-methylthiopentenyl-1-phosphate phosphatase
MSKAYFIDFDGTIALEDTTILMVKKFADKAGEELNKKWERGELSTEQVAIETFKLFDCQLEDIIKLLDNVKIDPYFKEFLKKVENDGDKVFILSDGYDVLIKHILQRENLDYLPYYANTLLAKSGFKIILPYYNPSCGLCGVCKTNLLKELSSGFNEIIYIGDGYSDSCPIKHAHRVYAKDKLYQIAKEKGINAIRFSSFKEIIADIWGVQ